MKKAHYPVILSPSLVILSPSLVILSPSLVILSPSLVILSEAKDLALAAQGKLREESRSDAQGKLREESRHLRIKHFQDSSSPSAPQNDIFLQPARAAMQSAIPRQRGIRSALRCAGKQL